MITNVFVVVNELIRTFLGWNCDGDHIEIESLSLYLIPGFRFFSSIRSNSQNHPVSMPVFGGLGLALLSPRRDSHEDTMRQTSFLIPSFCSFAE